jgi:hypothetical protein
VDRKAIDCRTCHKDMFRSSNLIRIIKAFVLLSLYSTSKCHPHRIAILRLFIDASLILIKIRAEAYAHRQFQLYNHNIVG